MGTLTNAGRTLVANHVTNGTALTAYTPYYGLILTVTDANLGTVTEVTAANGYARKTVTWATPTHASGVTTVLNATDLKFDKATAAWGTPVAVGKWDAATGGNLLEIAPIASGDQVAIAANMRLVIDAGRFSQLFT